MIRFKIKFHQQIVPDPETHATDEIMKNMPANYSGRISTCLINSRVIELN